MQETTPRTLFDDAEFEPLVDVNWNADEVRDAVAQIVDDTLGSGANSLWRIHPDDAHDPSADPEFASCLYFGAAGVMLALDWLHRELGTPMFDDLEQRCELVRDTHRAHPELKSGHPSWMIGESGVEAVVALLTNASLDSTIDLLQLAVDNPTHDPLTGAGNALDALLSLHARRPDDERLVERFRTGVERELDALETGPAGCDMWAVDLYGRATWMIGAGHGAAGTLHPMLRGLELLDETRRDRVLDVTRRLLATTAVRDGDLVNWTPDAVPDSGRVPVQWCHGAPGIILACSIAAKDHEPTRDLLRAGGELAWHAGPLVKGPTICHGTAGNALAFLELFDLTGDELWLDRARRFAMHALHQVRARREQVGAGRYSLFTGDLGVAVALVQIEQSRTGLLGLDFL